MTVSIEPVRPADRPRRMAVFGPGGHGKTTLAGRLAAAGLRVGVLDTEDGLAALESLPDGVRSNLTCIRAAGLPMEAVREGWGLLLKSPIDVLFLDSFSRLEIGRASCRERV